MPKRFPVHKPFPPRERKQRPEAAPRKSAHDRGYDHQWRKLRQMHLAQHPMCVYCARAGQAVPGEVVDHITPHKGNRELLYDPNNLQTLCKPHHDSVKQSEERNPTRRQIGPDGLPVNSEEYQRDGGGSKSHKG